MKKLTVILSALLLVLSVILGVMLFTFVIKPRSTIVPEFVGKSVSEVYSWCAGLDESHSCQVTYDDAEGVDKDIVFEQSIPGGSRLSVSTVNFKAATGNQEKSAEVALPFIGPDTNKSDIEAWALTFGIENVTYIEENSDTVEKNHVIRIEPSANARKDTPFRVYISIGKAESKPDPKPEEKDPEPTEIIITFGDYLGLTVEKFERKATALGLKPNHNPSRDQYDPHIEFGNIVWHGSGTYEPGETFNYGVCINELLIEPGKYVGISEGSFIKTAKELGLTPTHLTSRDAFSTKIANGSIVTHGSGVYVKDEAFNYGLSLGPANVEVGYEGASEEVFISYLSKFGLKPNRKTATSDKVSAGRILSYYDGKYSSGDTVTYWVSLGADTKVGVPSFAGKDESELLKFLSRNGLKAGIRSVQNSMTPEGKIISNDEGAKTKGSSINYVVSSGPYIPTARVDKFEYLSNMISTEDDYYEAAEKAELYFSEKGFTNYVVKSVFLSSVKPGQLLQITVDGVIHSKAKDYPIYSKIEIQISSWLMSPPHN